jgi:hypothetical protein
MEILVFIALLTEMDHVVFGLGSEGLSRVRKKHIRPCTMGVLREGAY